MNPRITLNKRRSPWGVVSWDAFVDGDFVWSCEKRKEAVKVAEARIERLAREEAELRDYINGNYPFDSSR